MPARVPVPKKVVALFRGGVERALLLNRLNEIYSRLAVHVDPKDFIDRTLDCLNISWEIDNDELNSIPREGPLVVVCNHPFGAIEGLILSSILLHTRPDTKIIANYLLGKIPQLKEMLFCVDPFRTEATRQNLKPIKDALFWLKEGHILALFPAGEVSSINLRQFQVIDPEWHMTAARIVRKTRVPVMPVFFEGMNSALFQAAGLLHPKLRTALLPRELLNKQDRVIKVRMGRLIPFQKIERFNKDDTLTAYLRMRTYALKHREDKKPAHKGVEMYPKNASYGLGGFCESPSAQETLSDEIKRLPQQQLLLDTDDYSVYHAKAHQMPNLLFEIGRLRELSFRRNGEGTGRAIDLDRFDLHYTHLFVWNNRQHEIIGAYRLGLADAILDRFGQNGLYSNTLFNYKNEFLQHIAEGIELGRSFVRPEYQKLYLPLLLLWKGIARFMVRNPSYTTLFGLVSVSDAYSSLSRQLIVSYLTMNHYAPELARFVKPKKSAGRGLSKKHRFHCPSSMPSNIDELSSLIADIENDRKGIPVLLKQYVKLGGKLMSFCLDPSFGNVLDGLILVDLLKCDRRIMTRFMGPEGADHYFRYHQELSLQNMAS